MTTQVSEFYKFTRATTSNRGESELNEIDITSHKNQFLTTGFFSSNKFKDGCLKVGVQIITTSLKKF
jgi:hypothetical protein